VQEIKPQGWQLLAIKAKDQRAIQDLYRAVTVKEVIKSKNS